MSNIPVVGDRVLMPFMGDDVYIEVNEVPENQPLSESEEIYAFVDQYGDLQLAEWEADYWITVNPGDLSPVSYDVWEEYRDEFVANISDRSFI